MTFINDDKLPLDFAQSRLVVQDVLIGGQDDIKLFALQICRQNRSFSFGSPIDDHFDRGSPFSKFTFPIRNCGERNHHKVGSLIPFVSNQIREKTNCLDRFPQAHLICQYAIQIVIVQRNHPIKALELILLELATFEQVRLFSDLFFNRMGYRVVNLGRIYQTFLDLFRITVHFVARCGLHIFGLLCNLVTQRVNLSSTVLLLLLIIV